MSGELCEEIAERVRRGQQPDSIESDLRSSRPGLREDERAALWLLAFLAGEAPLRHRFVRDARPVHVEYAHD